MCILQQVAADAPIGTTPVCLVKGGIFCRGKQSHLLVGMPAMYNKSAWWIVMRPRCLLTWEQAMQATDSGWLSQLCVRAAHVVMSYQVPLQRAALCDSIQQ